MNILIPLAGKSAHFDTHEFPYPWPLIEINGKTIIQKVIENYASIPEKKFVFVVNRADSDKFHLDNILSLLTDNMCEIIRLSGGTKGAACSSLMAIEHINTSTPLIIANGDQIIVENLAKIMSGFIENNFDAGVITFESVHPKWSYVRTDKNGLIIEAAEKRPISKNAIAGLYYFNEGRSFVQAAIKMIEKDASVNDAYYIAPTLNEMVLAGKKLGYIKIDSLHYHSFYSPQKIQEYEKYLKKYEND